MELSTLSSVTSNIAATYTKTTNSDGSVTESLEFNASKSEVNASKFSDEAAVYEKSSEDNSLTTDNYKKSDRTALIQQLKADQEKMINNLLDIVMKTINGQGSTFAIASQDDMWKFLAEGKFTADEETVAKAKEDISENGYWGVNQTSDRIVDFAIALSGGDSSKADDLLAAFKKGYEQATGTWGKELPEISKKTYDAVEDKFNQWKNGTYKSGNSNASNVSNNIPAGTNITYMENISTVNASTYIET
ncbi:MAG: hypothetical protein J6P79_07875 [Pseudobutyrivibrio sp.]|nr:hypothetical protein [Pseudobutyrivibrio sp.]